MMEHREADPMMIEEGSTASPRYRNSLCCCFPRSRARLLIAGSQSSTSTSSSSSLWERLGSARYDGRWWAPGLRILKKLREWSEIVAGPRWKTFIRRFGRNRCLIVGPPQPHDQRRVKFNYDPVEYSLNFDEGPRQGGDLDDEEDFRRYRNFSVKYASASIPGHASVAAATAAANGAAKGKDVVAVA